VFGQSELDYGMAYPDSGGRVLDEAGLHALLLHHGGHRDIVMLMRSDRASRIAAMLPPGTTRSQQGEIVLLRIGANADSDG
jgi:hypothetical protein